MCPHNPNCSHVILGIAVTETLLLLGGGEGGNLEALRSAHTMLLQALSGPTLSKISTDPLKAPFADDRSLQSVVLGLHASLGK